MENKVNFTQLVKSNTDLSIKLQDKLVQKLEETFDEDEQRWYASNLYMYMNYHPTDDFVVNLEDVFGMIGFINKAVSKRTLINNFTENIDYKITVNNSVEGHFQKEIVFLNIDTFKNLCMIARTENGKKIRKYYIKLENVFNQIIKEKIDEKCKRIEMDTKNSLFTEQYQNKPVLYLGMVEHTEKQQIVKYGYTQDTKSTLKRHQLSYGEDFHYIYAMESKEHYNLENKIQNHNDLASRHVKKYNGKDRQELLRLDKNFTVKNLVDLIVKMKTNNEDDYDIQLREIDLEKTKEIEKTKQIEAQEKTKQMELEVKILELEIRKLEVNQTPIQKELPKPSKVNSQTIKSANPTFTQDYKKTIVKKFMEVATQFSQKRSDYIFTEDLYSHFENWFQERNPLVSTPVSQTMFSRVISTIPEYNLTRIGTGPRVGNITPRKTAIIHLKFTL